MLHRLQRSPSFLIWTHRTTGTGCAGVGFQPSGVMEFCSAELIPLGFCSVLASVMRLLKHKLPCETASARRLCPSSRSLRNFLHQSLNLLISQAKPHTKLEQRVVPDHLDARLVVTESATCEFLLLVSEHYSDLGPGRVTVTVRKSDTGRWSKPAIVLSIF